MKPKIICLVPVKNEAWILKTFLECASLWADHIIIADQGSTDSSRQIAMSFPKVILIENKSETFNEAGRQKLLIEEARKIPGEKILFALDADEILSSNSLHREVWETILAEMPGTTFQFERVNIKPGFQKYWSEGRLSLAYFDDGRKHAQERAIHTLRIPENMTGKKVYLPEIKILHHQYADWQRMRSKHNWYQCYELALNPKKSGVRIYRQYHHMYSVRPVSFKSLPAVWFSNYESRGISLKRVSAESSYYWDGLVRDYFKHHGARYFEKLNIWKTHFKEYSDPRGIRWKWVHRYLELTQPWCRDRTQRFSRIRPVGLFLASIDQMLVFCGF